MSYTSAGKTVKDSEGRMVALGKNGVLRGVTKEDVKDSDRVLTPEQFKAECARRNLTITLDGKTVSPPPPPAENAEEKKPAGKKEEAVKPEK